MRHTSIDGAKLREKSRSLGMRFPDLVVGFVLESLIYLISESDFGEFLWLKGSGIFGVEHYSERNMPLLDFAYRASGQEENGISPGQRLSLKMGYVILGAILNKEKVPEIKWMGRALEREDSIELEISGEFEGMEVPLTVRLTELVMDVEPLRRELPLFMENGRSISYCAYPSEEILAGQLFRIISEMELIGEMRPYDMVYQILGGETVYGRHIGRMLGRLCREGDVPLEPGRADELLGYRDYSYMRMCWEEYLGRHGKEAPSWDDVMDQLSRFLPPIWASVCADEVFFGDWMPELGRFLE